VISAIVHSEYSYCIHPEPSHLTAHTSLLWSVPKEFLMHTTPHPRQYSNTSFTAQHCCCCCSGKATSCLCSHSWLAGRDLSMCSYFFQHTATQASIWDWLQLEASNLHLKKKLYGISKPFFGFDIRTDGNHLRTNRSEYPQTRPCLTCS